MDQKPRKQISFNLHLPSFFIGVGLTLLIGAVVYLLINRNSDTPQTLSDKSASQSPAIIPYPNEASELEDSNTARSFTVHVDDNNEQKLSKETEQLKKGQKIASKQDEERVQLMNKIQQFSEKEEKLEIELTLLTYIKNYVSDPVNREELIPTNIGVSDANIQAMIVSYNNIVNRYKKLKTTAGLNDPEINSLNHQMKDERRAIITSLDNLINATLVQLKDMRKRFQETQARLSQLK